MIRNAVGLTSLALIVAGVWGLAGWQAGVIVAGLPFAGFWIWGEARRVVGNDDMNPES